MFSTRMTIPSGTTNNIADCNGNYLYGDNYDCFVTSPYNEQVRLFLIADDIWAISNQSYEPVFVEVMAVQKNENMRVVNLEVLNPNDSVQLPFSAENWHCYCLEPNQMYLDKVNGVWHAKCTSYQPVYNNKVIAFSRV